MNESSHQDLQVQRHQDPGYVGEADDRRAGLLELRDTIRGFADDSDVRFVLNLGGVSYIDSSGLGELVSTYTTIRNRQGDVRLLNLTTKARDLLQMTKLLTVFDTFDDESKAVASLEG